VDIQTLAAEKFQSTGKGLTYKDLLRPQYRRADSSKRAQRILKYHKNRGNLITNTPISIPQEYFCNKEHARLSALYNERSILPQPSGLTSSKADHENAIAERKKAENLGHAVVLAVSDADGVAPTGMHNVHIHVTLPSPAYAKEVYEERLHYIKPQNTKQRAKKLEAKMDNYRVRCLVYPHGKIIITIPCTEKPFPINLDSPEQTSIEFIALVAAIRHQLTTNWLSDSRGIIVPPIQSDAWRFVHADLNWDIPTTALNFLDMCDVQITHFNDVWRFYKKQIDNHLYVRIEQGTHQFSNALTTVSFNESIGATIIAAVKEARDKLRVMKEGAAL